MLITQRRLVQLQWGVEEHCRIVSVKKAAKPEHFDAKKRNNQDQLSK
jgi:hypothetical protein